MSYSPSHGAAYLSQSNHRLTSPARLARGASRASKDNGSFAARKARTASPLLLAVIFSTGTACDSVELRGVMDHQAAIGSPDPEVLWCVDILVHEEAVRQCRQTYHPASCAGLFSEEPCHRAFVKAHVELQTGQENALRACAEAYCPLLDAPRPALCDEALRSAPLARWFHLQPELIARISQYELNRATRKLQGEGEKVRELCVK